MLYRPSGVLALLVALVCCHAKLGFVPFDQAEADTEIAEGALIEYSGPPLAMFKLTQAVLLATLPVLLVTVFWGGVETTPAALAALRGEGAARAGDLRAGQEHEPARPDRPGPALLLGAGRPAVAIVALVLARMGW